MQYGKILPARFLSRPNRFVARVEAEGEELVCHVKNTGRCRELLVPGATVWLEESPNPSRKTKFDLIAVEKGDRLINMDAQAPNKVFGEWAAAGGFREGLTLLRPETTYGSSRFDFYWESSKSRGFVEVKGVTLEEDGVVRFRRPHPARGEASGRAGEGREAGYEAAVCFVIQMENVRWFAPNDETHPEFGQALRRAAQAGVEILAMDCAVTPQSLTMGKSVPIRL